MSSWASDFVEPQEDLVNAESGEALELALADSYIARGLAYRFGEASVRSVAAALAEIRALRRVLEVALGAAAVGAGAEGLLAPARVIAGGAPEEDRDSRV